MQRGGTSKKGQTHEEELENLKYKSNIHKEQQFYRVWRVFLLKLILSGCVQNCHLLSRKQINYMAKLCFTMRKVQNVFQKKVQSLTESMQQITIEANNYSFSEVYLRIFIQKQNDISDSRNVSNRLQFRYFTKNGVVVNL